MKASHATTSRPTNSEHRRRLRRGAARPSAAGRPPAAVRPAMLAVPGAAGSRRRPPRGPADWRPRPGRRRCRRRPPEDRRTRAGPGAAGGRRPGGSREASWGTSSRGGCDEPKSRRRRGQSLRRHSEVMRHQPDRPRVPQYWSTMSRAPSARAGRSRRASTSPVGQTDGSATSRRWVPRCAAAGRSPSCCSPWPFPEAPRSPRAVGRSAGGPLRVVVWALGAGVVGLLFLVQRSWFLGLFGRAWVLALLRVGADRPRRPVGRALRRRVAARAAGAPGAPGSPLADRAHRRPARRHLRRTRVRREQCRRRPRCPQLAVRGQPRRGRHRRPLQHPAAGRRQWEDRVGTRPDSIQLVSVDAETGRRVTFGFSRDMENIDFRPGSVMQRLMPEGWNCGDDCLLNGLYTWAEDHRDQFPAGTQSPGVARHARGRRGGQRSDGALLRHGRPARVPEDGRRRRSAWTSRCSAAPPSAAAPRASSAGSSRAGSTSTATTRSGTPAPAQGSTNYERMARQRCVMTAMVDQLDPQTVLLRFQKIAAASSGWSEPTFHSRNWDTSPTWP